MGSIRKFKGLISFVLAFALILQFPLEIGVNAAFVPDIDKIYSEGAYMVNLDTGVVVYSKNENERFYPASTTKIMTAIIVLENCDEAKLNSTVRIGSDAFNEFWTSDLNKQGASNAALEAGQTNITYLDCLYALMIASACEAANILALNLCGSIEGFTDLMNQKAQELGCKDTHFSNAHGLWEAENYSTPYDMYLIARYGYDRVPKFMEICDAASHSFPPNQYNPDGYTKFNINPLISPSSEYYLDYVHGIKTGSIDVYYDKEGNTHSGGRCLVSSAQKNGFTYLTVTMQAPYFSEAGERINYNVIDHYNLYKWAYDSFVYQTVVEQDAPFAEVDVEQGEENRLMLLARNDFTTIVPKDLAEGGDSPVQVKKTIIYDSITAPVSRGEVLGKLDIIYQGELVQTIDLIASKSVERSQIAFLADRARSLTDTSWFIPLLILLAVCIAALMVLLSVRRRKLIQEARRKERRRRRNSYR